MKRLILALLIPLTLSTPCFADDWEKISEDDGIKVYQKKGGEKGTGVSLRGETVLNARMDDILDTMKDNSRAHLWIPMVKERRDLQQLSDNERIEFTHIGMPWPITDRYFINRAKAERLPNGQMRIFVQSVDNVDEAWVNKDKVLGFLHYSEFMLTPVGSGDSTHMVIEVNSDPRGLIPKFLVNAAQRSWPRKFFTGLNGMLKEAGLLKTPAAAH